MHCRHTVNAPLLHNCHTIAAPSLHHHCTIAAPSLHYCHWLFCLKTVHLLLLLWLSQPSCCKDDSNGDDGLVAAIVALHLLPHLNLHASAKQIKRTLTDINSFHRMSYIFYVCAEFELHRHTADKINDSLTFRVLWYQISTYFKKDTYSYVELKNILLPSWLLRKFVLINYQYAGSTNQCRLAISIETYNILASDVIINFWCGIANQWQKSWKWNVWVCIGWMVASAASLSC